MTTATVELTASLTLTRNGRTFKKGYPQTLTGQSEIKYFESQRGFSVVRQKQAGEAPAAVPEKEDEQPETELYSRDKLKSKKKKQLLTIADGIELLLTGDEKKSEMIEAILEAQEALEDTDEDADEDE